MPRTKRQDSTRLNLETKPEVRRQIERLKKKTGAESLTEVIRQALNDHERIVDLRRKLKGGKATLILRDNETGEEKEVIII